MAKMLLLFFISVYVFAARGQEEELQRLTCAPPSTPAAENVPLNCSKTFPTEEYNRVLQSDERMQAIVRTYGEVSSERTGCPDASDAESATSSSRKDVDKGWSQICPSSSYSILKWGIYLPLYEWCYIITPVNLTHCLTHYCLWTGPWPFYRCIQDYNLVYFWAFCPNSDNPFVFVAKKFPQCCSCKRFWCKMKETKELTTNMKTLFSDM